MSVHVSVTVTGTASVSVAVGHVVANRRGLNAALGSRLEGMLKDHFRAKGGEKFWNEIAEATQLESVSEDGAVVAVADRRFNVHVYGGTVRPVEAKALTIPIHPMAKRKFVRVLEREMGIDIFRPNKKGGGKMNILAAQIGGELVALYALRSSVTIPRDPAALPPESQVEAALLEEATTYLEREIAEAERRLA